MSVTQAGSEILQRCPHQGCSATLPTAEPGEELRLCLGCGRASSRCIKENKGIRCPALNHPLARFCRRCGVDLLGRGWPRTLWAGEASGMRSGTADESITLGPAETIYDLDADHRLDGAFASAPHLIEAAGQLWIACGDGQTLLRVNPGKKAELNLSCDLDRLATGEGSSPLRLHASGPWMTVTSETGIGVIDLIEVDDLTDESWTHPLWKPSKAERLVAGPVFLPARADPMARIVVWVIVGPEGASLGVAKLPGASLDRPDVLVHPFETLDGPMPTFDADGPSVAIITGRDGSGPLVLATRDGLYVVELPKPEVAGPAILRRFWDRPPPLSAMGGVVVVPGELGTDGKPRPAYVFAASRDGDSPALAILRPEPGYAPVLVRGAYLPLSVVQRRGASSALVLDGHSLALIGIDGRLQGVAEAPALASASEFRVHGRLALASGQEIGTTTVWFAMAFDLSAGRLVGVGSANGQSGGGAPKLVSTRPASGLVPLGRYLYRVAEIGSDRFSLVRYPILFHRGL